jgi:uridine kinase
LDSVDHDALLEGCLRPFRAGGRQITVSAAAQQDDGASCRPPVLVPGRAVLVVDGVFLLRARLRELWTVAIYLKASPAECLERARHRDRPVLGSVAEVERRYLTRTVPLPQRCRA